MPGRRDAVPNRSPRISPIGVIIVMQRHQFSESKTGLNRLGRDFLDCTDAGGRLHKQVRLGFLEIKPLLRLTPLDDGAMAPFIAADVRVCVDRYDAIANRPAAHERLPNRGQLEKLPSWRKPGISPRNANVKFRRRDEAATDRARTRAASRHDRCSCTRALVRVNLRTSKLSLTTQATD